MHSRVVTAGLVAVAALVVLRVGVAPAESCPRVTPEEARAAAEDAVQWFAANQEADGSFAYRVDESGDDLGGYNVTRHAGVLMSLYQAAGAGIDGALDVADGGLDWARANLERAGGGQALGSGGSTVPTGASALLLAAVDERRLATGDPATDDLAEDLATFLAATVEPSGAVLAMWDLDTDRPVPDTYSIFFTGEALWALSRVGDPAADAIADYVPRRDDVEDLFPPTSDHWAAYAWAERTALGETLSEEQLAHARRMADVFGIEVRTESTRWTASGVGGWLRPGQASGAGLGTLGEGSAALLRVFGPDSGTGDGLARRVACVAGMLVARQADGPGPAQSGAWFTDGVTQMDDQQHALSALLAAGPTLAAGDADDAVGGGEEPWGLAVVALALLAASNPARVRDDPQPELGVATDGFPTTSTPSWRGGSPIAVGIAGWTGAVALAGVSGPIADWLDISPASLRVAAGAVLGVASIVGLVTPQGGWSDGLAIAATGVVAMAAGVDNGTLAVAVGALPATAAVAWLPASWRRPLTARIVAAVGLVVAFGLVTDGVLGV